MTIPVGAYLYFLAVRLYGFYHVSRERVHLHLTLENITITIDIAIPLGLVMNEVIANSLKHAFPNERAGAITITGKEAVGMLEIRITDNGIGMPPITESEDTETFGLQLIRMLSDQLDGTVGFLSPPGTTVVLRIPKPVKKPGLPAMEPTKYGADNKEDS